MDRPSIQQLMEEKYDDLPSVVRNVIDSEDIGSAIVEIASKNNLKEEQSDLLADEIGYVILGHTPITRFKQLLQDNVGLPPSRALSISTEVYGTVFQPIKNFLKDSDDDMGGIRQSIDGISFKKPSQVSIPVKSSVPLSSTLQTSTQSSASVLSNENVFTDNESLSHHDILSEIENPTPSVSKVSETSIATSKPEYSDFDAYKNPTLDLELQSEEVNGQVQVRNPIFIPGSIHHDVGSSLNSFKPISTEGESASQIPTKQESDPSKIIADKLSQKLESAVSQPLSETVVPVPKTNISFDPYREPIE